jgi:DNA invertase Pin-like site-specific DNA recombinase
MARIAYARVSTKDTKTDTASQLHALKQAGYDKLFQERGSGAKADRKELAKALAACSAGDTFVFFSLSRVGRSVIHLHQIGEDLKKRGVAMYSVSEHIDTSTAAGEAFYGMLAVFAQFERACTMERIAAGLENARVNGTRSGKPIGAVLQMTPSKIAMAKEAMARGVSRSKVAEDLGVSRQTLYNYIPPNAAETETVSA